MMRSVLVIGERDGQLAASVENADPPLPENYDERIAFGYTSGDLPSPDDVSQYGATLLQGLRQHPAVAAVLERAFASASATPHALALILRAEDGRRVRWEALSDAHGKFVALDGRCPISRVTRRLSSTPHAAQAFEPPLRVLAYVSGVGLDMRAEWDALVSALDQAHKDGLAIKATIHIGLPSLRDEAIAECAAGMHPAIDIAAMPQAAFELEQQIQRARPHVLHFFCHGRGGMGASFLELATAKEHQLGLPGSVVLSTETLAGLEALRETWLVVLNCCEGAQGDVEVESMAEELVRQSGTRAIGMLEQVTSGEASRFSAALYPELFALFGKVLSMKPGDHPLYVDLAPVLTVPRRALSDVAPPALRPRWTLPVLYQDLQLLEVVRAATNTDGNGAAVITAEDWRLLRAKTETVAGLLAALPPDTPEAARIQILALLEHPPVVPAALRPDRWGRFGQGL